MTTGGYDPFLDPHAPRPDNFQTDGYYVPPEGPHPPTQYWQEPEPEQTYYEQPEQDHGRHAQPEPAEYDDPAHEKPAELGIRFACRFIDGVIALVVGILLTVPFGAGYQSIATVGVIVGFAYFVIMESVKGQTVGKRVLGLTVRGPHGAAKPTPQQSAIRNAFMLLCIIPFVGWGLLLAAGIVIAATANGSPNNTAKHDEYAGGTEVVVA